MDDENIVRMFIANAIDRAFPNALIEEAASAEAAVCRLQSGEGYSLLIVDKNMPGMTGIELAANLRRAGNDVPIILATGLFTPETEALAHAAGINRCLAKPFTLQELFSAIAAELPQPQRALAR